jgi:hypothetical protein
MGLFDFFRRSKPSPTKLSGTDGVFSFGGTLVSFEKNPKLRGTQLYKTFDEMVTNTVVIGAGVRYFQNLVGGTSWSITPNEKAGADGLRAAEIIEQGLVKAQLSSMPWFSVVRKAALYKFYGFSAHEWKLRKRTDGMMVFADIQHRPQYTVERWNIPPEGGRFLGFEQRAYGAAGTYYVHRDQMFYCVDNTLNDNPDGMGLLRHVAEHTRRLAEYEKYEGYGYQSDLRGMPVGRVPGAELLKKADGKPANWLSAQTAAIHALIENHFKTPNQGIVLDSEPYRDVQGNPVSSIPKWAIELIKSESNGLADINVVIERLNREIARVLGMEWMLLGGDGKGSLALSRDKTSMFASVLEGALAELAWFATHDLVFPLLRYNGLDPEVCAPQLAADPIATERVEAAVAALVGLAQAGAPLDPNDPAIDQIRRRLHLADSPKVTPEMQAAMQAPRAPFGPGGPGRDADRDDGLNLKRPASEDDDEVEIDTSDLEGDPDEVDAKPEDDDGEEPEVDDGDDDEDEEEKPRKPAKKKAVYRLVRVR